MIKTKYIYETKETLFWFNLYGFGYLRNNAEDTDVYDSAYFQKYVVMADTDMGRNLTSARKKLCELVLKEYSTVCDVGIGCGNFVESMSEYECKGFDVNTVAKEWLVERELYADPYSEKFDWLTLWDVFEHIDDIHSILKAPRRGVIMSIPIYKDFTHCTNSKHLRPNEHIWYFTHNGLIGLMKKAGYDLVYTDNRETVLGREDIISYIFKKKTG